MVAEEYHHGHLDWFSFDVDRQRQLKDVPETLFPENSFEERARLRTYLRTLSLVVCPMFVCGSLRTAARILVASGRTPLMCSLLLAEFGLVYGNDWTVIPYNVEVGTLAEIKGIIITDVFGVQTFIRAAGHGQAMSGRTGPCTN